MIHRMYSLYDRAVDVYSAPFLASTDEGAMRAVKDVVESRKDQMISKHPEDFVLYCVGEFDDSQGFLGTECPGRGQICTVAALVRPRVAEPFEGQELPSFLKEQAN